MKKSIHSKIRMTGRLCISRSTVLQKQKLDAHLFFSDRSCYSNTSEGPNNQKRSGSPSIQYVVWTDHQPTQFILSQMKSAIMKLCKGYSRILFFLGGAVYCTIFLNNKLHVEMVTEKQVIGAEPLPSCHTFQVMTEHLSVGMWKRPSLKREMATWLANSQTIQKQGPNPEISSTCGTSILWVLMM